VFRDALRPWVRKGRLLRDLVLHGYWRRRAWRELRAAPPSSVIFLCNGNICRSPYAERAFRKAVPEPFASSLRVASMGLLWPGRAAPPVAQACAVAHGVDLADHLSAAFEYRGGAPDELLVVMTAQQRREVWHRSAVGRRVLLLGDLDPVAGERRDIADPVDQPYEIFEACYTRIDRCVAELARALTVGAEVSRPARPRR
jgi:protein-tyrosine phosphatase